MPLTDRQQRCLKICNGVLKRRIAEGDETGADLARLYRNRLERNNLLGPFAPAVSLITAHAHRWERACDIGAAIGTIAAAIAVEGLPATAFEHDRARFPVLETVAAEVHAAFPRAVIEPRAARFPDEVPANIERQVAIAVQCVFRAPPEVYAAFEAAVARFDVAIVQFGVLFTGGETPLDERYGEGRAISFCARHNLPPPVRLFSNVDDAGIEYATHLVGRGSQQLHDAAL